MKLLHNTSHDPAFNLALEEYLLTQHQDDFIVLWRNSPAVIVGSNQNTREEIHQQYVDDHNITIVRRQSGGGAVFHDLGNINYTVIHNLGENDFDNYAKFTAPIVQFLSTLGVESQLVGRNDLLIDGMKFSGNAQAVRGHRIMHHGTLLFDADVSHLTGALRPKPAKIESKGIKSVRSRVTNIAEHLPQPMAVEDFLLALYSFYRKQGLEEYTLSKKDLAATQRLVEEKYSRWEWNIGNSPEYTYQNTIAFPSGLVELYVTVDKGIITDARIMGDFFGIRDIALLEKVLIGARHDKKELEKALRNVPLSQYISGLSLEDFLSLF